jgi:hypothetical protein
MERAMSATGLGKSDFYRVAIVAGATAAVMVAAVLAKPIYSGITDPKSAGRADVSQHVADQQPKAETISFVPSPTIDTNPKFFFGAGDGSNGYYAEQPGPR